MSNASRRVGGTLWVMFQGGWVGQLYWVFVEGRWVDHHASTRVWSSGPTGGAKWWSVSKTHLLYCTICMYAYCNDWMCFLSCFAGHIRQLIHYRVTWKYWRKVRPMCLRDTPRKKAVSQFITGRIRTQERGVFSLSNFLPTLFPLVNYINDLQASAPRPTPSLQTASWLRRIPTLTFYCCRFYFNPNVKGIVLHNNTVVFDLFGTITVWRSWWTLPHPYLCRKKVS